MLTPLSEHQKNVFIMRSRSYVIEQQDIDELKRVAASNTQGVARLLMHGNPDSTLHQMLITLSRSNIYFPPHIHEHSPKSYHLLEGSMSVIAFDPDGMAISSTLLTTDTSHIMWIEQSTWHTINILSPSLVYIETLLGPHKETKYADWAPQRSDIDAGIAFIKQIKVNI